MNGNHFPNVELKDGAYTAAGNRGRYIMVIPDQKLVIVHRVNTDTKEIQVNRTQFGKLVSLILKSKLPASK